MKQIMAVLIVVSVFSISMAALAADLEFGTQAAWQFTDQLDLGLTLGLYRRLPEEGEAYLTGFGRGILRYTLEKPGPSVQFVLDGEMRGSEGRLYGGYVTPLSNTAALQIGLAFEKKEPADPVSLVLKGAWQVGAGNLKVELQEGSNELVQAQYRIETCLGDRVSLAAEPGIRYIWRDGGSWEIPVELSARLKLDDHLDFKVQAANTFAIGGHEQKKPLMVSFYLQRDFDWRKNTMKTPVMAQPVQVPAGLGPELIETGVEVVPLTETEPAVESVPVEEITLLPVKEVEKEDSVTDSETDEDTNDEQAVAEESSDSQIFRYDAESGTVYCMGQMFSVEPYIADKQMVFPIRGIVESLGGFVYWYDEPRQICLVLHEQKVFLDLEQGTYRMNGREIFLKGLLQLFDGHFYVGAEDLVQLLGVSLISEEVK